ANNAHCCLSRTAVNGCHHHRRVDGRAAPTCARVRAASRDRSRPMTTRRATCSCGQLNLTIEGEPARISMCHCLACQRRTGAVISNQARFRREQITFAGESTEWTRTADGGNALSFHFCPTCGSTVYWEGQGFPGYVAVAIGTFAD